MARLERTDDYPPRVPAGRDHLDALTSLRFIAAAGVLVLHYRDLLGPMPPWLFQFVVGGQYGVTFFFILSGFILTYRYHDWFSQRVDGAHYWRFQQFRIARLYPVYVLGLLLDTPWHLIERHQAGQLVANGQMWWASWLLNLVGLQAWVPAVPYAMYWNTPAWSVAAEFFFYATFPLLCGAIARRLHGTGGFVVGLAATVVVGVALYAAVIWYLALVARVSGETQYIVLVYNPLLRFSEFVAGCIAGRFFLLRTAGGQRLAARDARGRRLRDALIVIAVAATLARIMSADYTGPSQALWLLDVALKYAVFIVPFTAIILAVASGPTFLSVLLEHRWMVLLGEASYALYIIHWPVTTVLRMKWLGAWGTPVVHGLCLVGTIGAAVLVYRYVEVPMRAKLRGRGQREGVPAVASA